MTASSTYVIHGDSVSRSVTYRTAGRGTIRRIKKSTYAKATADRSAFAAAKAKGKP